MLKFIEAFLIEDSIFCVVQVDDRTGELVLANLLARVP